MASFREQLLQVMDQKNHWGWRFLASSGLEKSQLRIHFQQEYETYVRDFPIFLARILGRMNTSDHSQLKREIAENLFEEQTGGLSLKYSKGLSHPELFIKMMKGLGYKSKDFESIELLPTSLAYRCFLDKVTFLDDWRVAAAVLTLFVEGSVQDRNRMRGNYQESKSIKEKLKNHALVKYYGLKEKDADLVKAHHAVEGDHRKSAWETLLKIVPTELQPLVVQRMNEALQLWFLFRDGVCVEMGLESPEFKEILTGLDHQSKVL